MLGKWENDDLKLFWLGMDRIVLIFKSVKRTVGTLCIPLPLKHDKPTVCSKHRKGTWTYQTYPSF